MERHFGRVGETDTALEALRAKENASAADVAQGLSSIGLEYAGMAQNEKALQVLGEALETAAGAGDVELANARLAMGKARLHMTLLSSAQDNLLLAAAVLVKELGASHRTAIDAQVQLVACKAERGLLSQPVTSEEVAALVQAARERKDSGLLCDALLCAGAAHDAHGKAVSARRCVEEAVKLAREEGPPLAPVLGTGLLRLGEIVQDRFEDSERALVHITEAVEVLTGALGEEHPTTAFARGVQGHLQASMEASRRSEAKILECCNEEICACEEGGPGDEEGGGAADEEGSCCPEGQCTDEEEGKCCKVAPSGGSGPLPGVDLLEEALARCERVYGSSCRQIKVLLDHLAFAKSDEGDHEASMKYIERELDMAKELYSDKSLVYAEAFNCKGILLSASGSDEAVAHAERCLALHREILPEGHPDLAVVIINLLAEDDLFSEPTPESVPLLKEVAALQAKAEHVPLSQSSAVLTALAVIAQEEGDHDETCRLLVAVAENRLRIDGADHEATLGAVCDAAQELSIRKPDEAQNLLILALSKQRILPEVLSEPEELSAALEAFSGDKDTLEPFVELLDTYGTVLAMDRLHQDAIPIFSNALVLCKYLGGSPTSLVEVYMPLGVAYQQVGDVAQAMVQFASAAVIFRQEALEGGWTEKGLSNEVNLGYSQFTAGVEVSQAVEALKFAAEELIKLDMDPERLTTLLSNVAEVFETLDDEPTLIVDALRYRTLSVTLLTSLTEGDTLHPGLALALFRQGSCMALVGQEDEAKVQLKKSIEACNACGDHAGIPQAWNALNNLYIELEELDEALTLSKQLLDKTETVHGADSLEYSSALMQLARVHQEMDEGKKVLELTDQVLKLLNKHAPGSWNAAKVYKARSTAYAGEGDVTAALDEAKIAVEVLKKCVQDNPRELQLKEMLADTLSELGQFQAGVKHDFLGAQKSFEDALATRMLMGIGDCPQIAMDHVLLGSICKQLGQLSAGKAHAQEAARVARSAYQGQPHPVVGQVLLALSEFATDPHEKITNLTEVASIFMMTVGDAPDTAEVLVKLGQAFLETNQAKKGKAVLERAWRMLRDVAGPQDETTLEVHGLLTQLYHELGIPGQPDPNPQSNDARQPPAA